MSLECCYRSWYKTIAFQLPGTPLIASSTGSDVIVTAFAKAERDHVEEMCTMGKNCVLNVSALFAENLSQ